RQNADLLEGVAHKIGVERDRVCQNVKAPNASLSFLKKTEATALHVWLRGRLLDVIASVRGTAHQCGVQVEKPKTTQSKKRIVSLGNREYHIPPHRPYYVTDKEDCVLLAFIEQATMDEATLNEKSGLDDGPKVLRAIAKKYGHFAEAIDLPGQKAVGGY